MIKLGVVTTDSFSDYSFTKKAEYYDAEGYGVADRNNKDKLKKPVKIENTPCAGDEGVRN